MGRTSIVEVDALLILRISLYTSQPRKRRGINNMVLTKFLALTHVEKNRPNICKCLVTEGNIGQMFC